MISYFQLLLNTTKYSTSSPALLPLLGLYNANDSGYCSVTRTNNASDINPPLMNALNLIFDEYVEQEAPLTLRGQRGRCRNIKEKSQIFGSFPSPMPRPLFLWVWLYGGFWQTQVYTKFEVHIPSRCRNITGNPKILGSFLSPRPPPHFSLGVI